MMAELNPLISLRSSDSGLQILLHPLVLLNISDHVTRHFARQEKGPIVGALIGQQKGRTISLEHVFECNVVTSSNGDSVLSEPWFEERLQQFRDVHKDPPLDLVGWFTLTPPTGPTASQLPIHEHILQKFNETAVLLAFDPSGLENNTSHTTGKLPLTIYESTYEEDSNAVDGDKSMQVDGQQPSLTLRFRELPYYIETGEAEMISIDFVARGGGNATAIEANGATPHPLAVGTKKPVGDKGRDASKKLGKTPTTEEVSALSKEDEDLIANLTTRLTAVKTLESRLHLIKVYLSSISTQQTPNSQTPSTPTSFPQISHSILRNIRSLISHLSLLTPQQSDTFSTESLAQANDVAMVALLGQLGQSVQEIRELGKKFTVVDRARQHAESAMVMSGTHSRMDGFLRQPI
ncbi:COP9 complex subunit 6 [Histoplasma capsulatum var. duboisii H88]|uniref:COP9 signalosome complex subunit 6 n=1 Tax=Ajellomyces capsulatus (strain H88) TaxID=544711 RepID=A0A8A1LQG2_AJEC8|nr:COP9 complex subunit 6 [Histoplasma capsulatum var. duboisii H88]